MSENNVYQECCFERKQENKPTGVAYERPWMYQRRPCFNEDRISFTGQTVTSENRVLLLGIAGHLMIAHCLPYKLLKTACMVLTIVSGKLLLTVVITDFDMISAAAAAFSSSIQQQHHSAAAAAAKSMFVPLE